MIASFALFLFAVNGTVVNQTTGQPQPGATVTLYKIGVNLDMTGQRSLDATAILDYFAPLKKWLDEQNKGKPAGW